NSLVFFSISRRHTIFPRHWSSHVCSPDLAPRTARRRRPRTAPPRDSEESTVSFPFPVPHRHDPRWTREGGVHVRRGEGTARWLAGDAYTIKATAEDTNGALGFATAVVPPGGGPVAHAHDDAEEA